MNVSVIEVVVSIRLGHIVNRILIEYLLLFKLKFLFMLIGLVLLK